jgi:hypothetical protein
LGELVSGHQKPLEFLNPLTFVVLALPYGFGAVICRELIVRWNKGWPSLILFGLAYGVYEEAIVVRSMFNPGWQELGAMATYGYAGGLHWTYGLMLLHFHLVVSIGASVLLAHVLFPARRRETWVGRKALVACFVGLSLWLPLGWLMTTYRPPWTHYAGAWVSLLALLIAGRLASAKFFAAPLRQTPQGRWLFLLGCVNVSSVFIGIGLTAEHKSPPLFITFAGLLLIETVCLTLLVYWSGGGQAWNDRQRLAWVIGTLAFFIVFGAAQDAEEWHGRSIVSIAGTFALWRVWRHVSRRGTTGPVA